jgi:hypothetical protein
MARYSRKDVEALCKRLEGKANNILHDEQPQLANDLRAAATIIKRALASGLDTVEVPHAH